jgi:hypothetical protein
MTPLDWFTAFTMFEHRPLIQMILVPLIAVPVGYVVARYLNHTSKGETR